MPGAVKKSIPSDALSHVPDAEGRFGDYGGRYVPETLIRRFGRVGGRNTTRPGAIQRSKPSWPTCFGTTSAVLRRCIMPSG